MREGSVDASALGNPSDGELQRVRSALELRNIEVDIRQKRIDAYVGIVRTVAWLVGAIALFLLIQRPSLLLSQFSTKDEINRERAALLLDRLEGKSQSEKSETLALVGAIYGEDRGEWFDRVSAIVYEEARIEAGEEYFPEYVRLISEIVEKTKMLEREITQGSVSGTGPGYGPMALELRRQLTLLEQRAEAVRSILIQSGFLEENIRAIESDLNYG